MTTLAPPLPEVDKPATPPQRPARASRPPLRHLGVVLPGAVVGVVVLAALAPGLLAPQDPGSSTSPSTPATTTRPACRRASPVRSRR